MSHRLRVSFAKISIYAGLGIPRTKLLGAELLNTIEGALKKGPPLPAASRQGSITRYFSPVSGSYRTKELSVQATLVLGEGKTYKAPDVGSHAIEVVEYPKPPFRGQTSFVMDGTGTVAIESKDTQHLDPESVLELLKVAMRHQGNFETNVNVRWMTVVGGYSTMSEFIDSLIVLQELEFTHLRHSNPHSRDTFMDETANAGVTEIDQSSSLKDGIDKTHPRIKKEMEHAAGNYAVVGAAAGLTRAGFRKIEITEEGVELTITSEDGDASSVVASLSSTLREFRDKLRPIGPPPVDETPEE
jgi:hypothetical protein